MRLVIDFDGTPEEILQVIDGAAMSKVIVVGDHDKNDSESEDNTELFSSVSASPSSDRIGFAQRMALRKQFVNSRVASGQSRLNAALEFFSFDDEDLLYAISTVAAAKGIAIQAFGDGQIFKQFLDFISAHWQDILKLLLPLIGIVG